ncbi:hypothetical protein QT937_021885 [Xanthomonas campestris pv. campestris]|uniref:hypothetical protein n=1 Tax=Xanthomonas campestris TaxID=339 RepID=UPI0025A21F2D|nr:hypothetical protein [Xanthomonas campestris]MDM7697891.1 hypothetical protein [Xanthomonas campestris pv. campestris]
MTTLRYSRLRPFVGAKLALLTDKDIATMPFCQGVTPEAVEKALSRPRLASYATLLATTESRKAIGAYVWGLELNSALSPLLGIVEVVLRNAIHNSASLAFGKTDWLQDVLKWHGDKLFLAKAQSHPKISQDYFRRNCHPFHRQNVQSNGSSRRLKHWHSHVERKRDEILSRLDQDGKPKTPDQIVAHAMFGFWLDLLQAPFEDTNSPLSLWPRCERTAFSHDALLNRAEAERILTSVKSLRNRVTHHEPAWSVARPLTPTGVHQHMRTVVGDMTRLIAATDPNIVILMKNAGVYRRLDWLLDPQTVASFSDISSEVGIDFKRLNRAIRRFAKQLSSTPLPPDALTKIYRVDYKGRPLMTVTAFS